MKLLSWNIQWCRGMDGRVDPARIARKAKALCDPDVCCFQEVAENFATLEGSAGENQAEGLEALFPGYSAHFAEGVDIPDGERGRRRFGNMILSRLPVRQVFRHSLPWPPEPGVPNMPRVAIEAVVEARWGLVSVVTTHLEFFSAKQRAAQVERLCELQAERAAHAPAPPARYKGAFEPHARPAASILCGDFNMRPGDALVARLLQVWRDAWAIANPGVTAPPTFGLHDRKFGEDPYRCDFVLVTPDLAARLAAVRIDVEAQESDHQPVVAEFSP
ncbi:MAG: endonuclease/exonuclease/phosphatase family protein [Burkholderiales bacterium]